MYAKCEGKGCLKKETCRRFTDPPKEPQQSWAAFDELEECDHYRPNEGASEGQDLLAKVLKHKDVVHFGLMREIQESFDQAISEGYSPHDSLIHAIYDWDLDPYVILNYIRDEEA